jgi:hypothetical protein
LDEDERIWQQGCQPPAIEYSITPSKPGCGPCAPRYTALWNNARSEQAQRPATGRRVCGGYAASTALACRALAPAHAVIVASSHRVVGADGRAIFVVARHARREPHGAGRLPEHGLVDDRELAERAAVSVRWRRSKRKRSRSSQAPAAPLQAPRLSGRPNSRPAQQPGCARAGRLSRPLL